MENQSQSSKTAEIDLRLHSIGFEIQDLSPQRVAGHLTVTQKCCQVWEVTIQKIDPSNKQKRSLISSSRVTLLCNMPVPDNAKDADHGLNKHARL